jgi:hypothetical protein
MSMPDTITVPHRKLGGISPVRSFRHTWYILGSIKYAAHEMDKAKAMTTFEIYAKSWSLRETVILTKMISTRGKG